MCSKESYFVLRRFPSYFAIIKNIPFKAASFPYTQPSAFYITHAHFCCRIKLLFEKKINRDRPLYLYAMDPTLKCPSVPVCPKTGLVGKMSQVIVSNGGLMQSRPWLETIGKSFTAFEIPPDPH